jgi:hypothetical protein
MQRIGGPAYYFAGPPNISGGSLMKKTILSGVVILSVLFSLAACRSSSSSAAQPTKAVITLSMIGTLPAGTLIYGANATVNLPAGVTAKASPSSANAQAMVTDTGVVTASGQASGAETVLASYATGTTPSTYKVGVYVAKSNGFLLGEFATVNCDIADGSFPAPTDFTVTDFKAVDQNGAAITGLTIGYTAAIQ